MGADQFLLTWNNHRSNFAEVFSQLRVQDELVDVTLLCDGGSYPAHRLVLAACSPYFHQLFTRLPTQHPIVYLRDVRQTELEALLEFIYRGEVSVANSELTGLIKIAESLRIKGLGDVSQRERDPAPFGKTEKRSVVTSPNCINRPKKAPRLANTERKHETETMPSIFSNSATAFGLRHSGFSQILENSVAGNDIDHDNSRDSNSPPPLIKDFKESKLRSCLEGQQPIDVGSSVVGSLPLNLLTQPSAAASLSGLFLKREIENREAATAEKKRKNKKRSNPFLEAARTAAAAASSSSSAAGVSSLLLGGCNMNDKDEKVSPLLNDVKQENICGEESPPTSPSGGDATETAAQTSSLLFPKLYEASAAASASEYGNTTNAFLTQYTQLLSSFHQQQLQNQPPSQISPLVNHHLGDNREEPENNFSSLIPTTVQEHQISPTPKDSAKSMTCQLCGATIKHIANFRRHMKQHLNPRRFPCPWCSAAFGRKDNLKTHTRKHHPVEVEVQEQTLGGSLPRGGPHSSDDIEEDASMEVRGSGRGDGHVFNGISGGESSPQEEVGGGDDSSGDQNGGEEDSLIIADEEEEDEKGEETAPHILHHKEENYSHLLPSEDDVAPCPPLKAPLGSEDDEEPQICQDMEQQS